MFYALLDALRTKVEPRHRASESYKTIPPRGMQMSMARRTSTTAFNHKITPYLWLDQEARQAAEFYVTAFGNGLQITNVTTLHDTPSDDAESVAFELAGQSFRAISAGPLFKFNPFGSFIVNFDPSRDPHARKNLNGLWEKLSVGSAALMPLDDSLPHRV